MIALSYPCSYIWTHIQCHVVSKLSVGLRCQSYALAFQLQLLFCTAQLLLAINWTAKKHNCDFCSHSLQDNKVRQFNFALVGTTWELATTPNSLKLYLIIKFPRTHCLRKYSVLQWTKASQLQTKTHTFSMQSAPQPLQTLKFSNILSLGLGERWYCQAFDALLIYTVILYIIKSYWPYKKEMN